MSLQTLSIVPLKPIVGQDVVTILKGTLRSPMLDGAITRVFAKIGVLTLHDEIFDSCEINGGCPVASGESTQTLAYNVPLDSPVGVTIKVREGRLTDN
jgi:hypothetical protein